MRDVAPHTDGPNVGKHETVRPLKTCTHSLAIRHRRAASKHKTVQLPKRDVPRYWDAAGTSRHWFIAPMEDIHFLAAISAGTRHAAAFSAPRACTLARTQADVFGRSNHMSSHAAPAWRRYAASKTVTDCGPCSHRLLRHREACCRAAKLPRRCPRPRLPPASWRAPSMYTACRA